MSSVAERQDLSGRDRRFSCKFCNAVLDAQGRSAIERFEHEFLGNLMDNAETSWFQLSGCHFAGSIPSLFCSGFNAADFAFSSLPRPTAVPINPVTRNIEKTVNALAALCAALDV